MSGYAVAQIEEIDEITDGRLPYRPVRFHVGSHRSMTCRRSCTSPSAIERDQRFRSLAAGDSDFDPIRDETAFKELVRGSAAEPATG